MTLLGISYIEKGRDRNNLFQACLLTMSDLSPNSNLRRMNNETRRKEF